MSSDHNTLHPPSSQISRKQYSKVLTHRNLPTDLCLLPSTSERPSTQFQDTYSSTKYSTHTSTLIQKNGLPIFYQEDKATQFTTASPPEHYTNGIQQGFVLSPTLFNLYMHDIPIPNQPNTHTVTPCHTQTILQYSHNTQNTRPLPHNYKITSTC